MHFLRRPHRSATKCRYKSYPGIKVTKHEILDTFTVIVHKIRFFSNVSFLFWILLRSTKRKFLQKSNFHALYLFLGSISIINYSSEIYFILFIYLQHYLTKIYRNIINKGVLFKISRFCDKIRFANTIRCSPEISVSKSILSLTISKLISLLSNDDFGLVTLQYKMKNEIKFFESKTVFNC